MHIMFVLWGQNLFHFDNSLKKEVFFWLTFASSVFSASKGIAGFLLYGPCKLVPTNGLFGGMGKLGFILLVLNIALTLCGKGAALFGFLSEGYRPVSTKFHYFSIF